MYKSIIKSTLRSLYRNKTFTILNLFGLALAFTSVIIIYLWIADELSYDTFHKDADDIYLVFKQYDVGGGIDQNPSTPYPLANGISSEIPEALHATKYVRNSAVVKKGEKVIKERSFCYTDSVFFNMFSYRFLYGDPLTCLNEKYSIVLTKEASEKYFKDKEAYGKTIDVDGDELKITAIVEPISKNSIVDFDFFVNIELMIRSSDPSDWGSHWLKTFVKVKKESDIQAVHSKLDKLIAKHITDENIKLRLHPIKKSHLYALNGKAEGMQTVLIFGAVGIFILVIAIINFMNLSTARYSKRSLEVGIRKVVGSSKKILIQQFLTESIFISFLGLLFSIIFVEVFLDKVNIITGKELSFYRQGNYLVYFFIIVVTTLTGVLAGTYPAWILSSFEPIHVLKGKFTKGKFGTNFRKILVIIQFSISIILMISTGVIYQQLNYITNKDIGMNRKNVYALSLAGGIYNKMDVFKSELLNNPDIVNVSYASAIPYEMYSIMRGLRWEGMQEEKGVAMGFISITDDFLETMEIELLDGRPLSEKTADDSVNVMFNEAAIKLLGWKNPVGKKFAIDEDSPGKIVGVVKDFNSLPLNFGIEPVIINYMPNFLRYGLIRIQEGKSEEALDFIESKWKEFAPEVPFSYTDLDQYYNRLYSDGEQMASLITIFSVLAIIISCLGLFGLASHNAEQRTKEIGIRKVHGASITSIFF